MDDLPRVPTGRCKNEIPLPFPRRRNCARTRGRSSHSPKGDIPCPHGAFLKLFSTIQLKLTKTQPVSRRYGLRDAHFPDGTFDRERTRMIFLGTGLYGAMVPRARYDLGEKTAMKVGLEHTLDIPPFKGRILSDYDGPVIVNALKECDALLSEGRILEDSRNRVGVVALPAKAGRTTEFVVKQFRTQGVDKWKSLVLLSKAQKAWRGSLALVKRGFLTPLPVAYLERRTSFFLEQSYFISEYVPDLEEVRGLFRELPHEELTPLLRALASTLARCVRSGILHRDLSDGNVLVEGKGGEPFRFFLLDTNRIRCKRRIGTFKGIKSLIRLGIPPELQRVFIEAYLDRSPVKCVHWLWYRSNKACFTGYIRLKELLKLKKLAQRLKIQ
jgi:serine/threonine protein kinase